MEYLTLNNGVSLPAVGFGTWDVRGEKGKKCILDALELGYRLIDTAPMYDNEGIVGKAIRESGLPRQDIFLTTKLYRPSASYQKAKETWQTRRTSGAALSGAKWDRCYSKVSAQRADGRKSGDL